MKKTFYVFALVLLALTSCEKDDESTKTVGESKEAYIVATSSTTWNYYSLATATLVGTGEEDATDNAAWFARDDWDIAICKYKVRTNSGAATTVGSQGGVYTSDEDVEFSALAEVPAGVSYTTDVVVTSVGHGGTTTELILSTAQVIQFKLDADGNMVMPPVYLASPVYIFKTADGKDTYKVAFTQYQNDDSVSGHVKFDFAQIY